MSFNTGKRPASEGFFSNISSAFTETFAQALPIWTAKQLDLQREDQLQSPLFDPRYAKPRQRGETLDTTGRRRNTGLFDFQTNNRGPVVNISGAAIATVAAIGIGLLILKRG